MTDSKDLLLYTLGGIAVGVVIGKVSFVAPAPTIKVKPFTFFLENGVSVPVLNFEIEGKKFERRWEDGYGGVMGPNGAVTFHYKKMGNVYTITAYNDKSLSTFAVTVPIPLANQLK